MRVYMLFDKRDKVYLSSGSRRIWENKSGVIQTAYGFGNRVELEIHTFVLGKVVSVEDLEPKLILKKL